MSTPFDPQPCCDTGAVAPATQDVNVVGSTGPTPSTTEATTGAGTAVEFDSARSNVTLFILVNGTVTSGVVELQGSHDGLNWVTIAASAALTTGVNQFLSLAGGAFLWFRSAITEDVVGGGNVTATLMYA